tara:strand:- start:9914 stop:12073 length:2160 start_codon:yes stop_codon:yes gene_type:complete
MRKFFREQAERVTTTYVEADGYVEQFNWFDETNEYKAPRPTAQGFPGTPLAWITENEKIVAASRPYVLEMTVTAANNAAQIVGGPVLTATDPAVIVLADMSAERVVRVNNATRRGIQRTIASGVVAGYSPYEVAYGSTATRKAGFRPLTDVVEHLYRGRPECIARTEMAYSNNGASLWRYETRGLNRVEVLDGPGCALTHHVRGLKKGESSPQDINGAVIPTEHAKEWQLAHPNCRRVFVPDVLPPVPRARKRPPPIGDYGVQALTAQQRSRIATDMRQTTRVLPKTPPPSTVPRPANPFERPDLRDLQTPDDYIAYGQELEAHVGTLAAPKERIVRDRLTKMEADIDELSLEVESAQQMLKLARNRSNAAARRLDVAQSQPPDSWTYTNLFGQELTPDEMDALRTRAALYGNQENDAYRAFLSKRRQLAEKTIEQETVTVELLAIRPAIRLEELAKSRPMGPPVSATGKKQYTKIDGSITAGNRRAIQDAQDKLPTAWLQKTDDFFADGKGLKVQTARNEKGLPRGSYNAKKDRIKIHNDKLGKSDNDMVALHEYVHRVGAADQDLALLMQRYYFENVQKGLPTTPDMREFFRRRKGAKPGFQPVMEWDDDWPSWYIGKGYGKPLDLTPDMTFDEYIEASFGPRYRNTLHQLQFGSSRHLSDEILTMVVETALGVPPTSGGKTQVQQDYAPWRRDEVNVKIAADTELMSLIMGVLAGF